MAWQDVCLNLTDHSLLVNCLHGLLLTVTMSSTMNGAYSRDKTAKFMLIVGQEPCSSIEFDIGHEINAVTFSANGKYLVSGGSEGVRVWRAHDGKHIASMDVQDVSCLAVSKDGRWIAAGSFVGCAFVWDATTYQQAFEHLNEGVCTAVDFSPDATALVASWSNTATIWSIPAGQLVRKLNHQEPVGAARYSPRGDRIATASKTYVLVWDSNDGRLLVDVKVDAIPWRNTGLVWCDDHLFVASKNKIKRFDASTGSTISEWPVPDTTSNPSCIALPEHGKFLAYSATETTFWGTSTHTQLFPVPQYQDTCKIALTLDGRVLAIAAANGRVAIKHLSHLIVRLFTVGFGRI